MSRRTVGLVIAALVVAGACSSASDESSQTTPTSATAPQSSTTAPEPPVEDPPATTAVSPDTVPTTTTLGEELGPNDQPLATVEVATINVLHGLSFASGCAEETDHCHAATRIRILWDHLANEAGCPEIVALQEISPRWFELVPEALPELCDGDHVLLTEDIGAFDQEMILTTLPVLDHARVELAGSPVWSAHWAQLDAGDGLAVDVFSTHYASSAFDPPCDDSAPATTCAASCPVGASLGRCHPFETLDFLAERAAPGGLQLVIGDLNKEIDDVRITTLIDAGFVDTYLEADNPECVNPGDAGCTSGIGGDTDLDGLDIAEQSPRSRIDFILARRPVGCFLVIDANDDDGDGTRTGHWANEPLAEPRDGLYWASDHVGVQADVGMFCSGM